MNAQKESLKKTSGVHTSSRKPSKKCVMKMKVEELLLAIRKKRRARKNVFDGRREFIGRLWKSSMINRKEPQVDDC